MPFEMTVYNESLVEALCEVYNRETAVEPFVVPLTPQLFLDQIAAKSFFSPEGCFLALEDGQAIGFALTSPGVDGKGWAADPSTGAVDGLFFPRDRLEVGDALLARCLAHLEGARTIYGFASAAGYPYWRGLYCGAEPVCLTNYDHAWIAFMAHGFAHHQQSLNYLGAPEPRAFRSDLDYVETDLDLSAPWAAGSWKSHLPKVLTAYRGDEPLGYVRYVELPFLSAYRQRRVAGIYGMQVYPPYRRQGIASSLLNYLYDWAHARGYAEILVGTTVENRAARRTCERAGMRVVGFRTGTVYRRHSDGPRVLD